MPTGIARDGWQQIDGCSAHHSNRQLQASACVPAGVHSQPIATTWRGSADMACGATYKRPARPVPCLERLMCESTAPWEACHLVHACARWERARALLVCTTLCLVIARARALRSLDPVKFACGQYDRNSGVAQARCGRRRQGPRGHAGDGRELPAKPASTLQSVPHVRELIQTSASCSSSSSRASPSSRRSSLSSAPRPPRHLIASTTASPSSLTSSAS